MEAVKKVQLECHCCTTTEDVYVCELDNCDYPLCSTCKEKALKLEPKCPGCRRSITIDIEEDFELETDEIEQESIVCKQICSRQLKDKIINYIYYYSMLMLLISAIIIVTTIVVLAGRMVTMVFKIGPNDYWCETLGEHHFGHFVGYGILGAILGFFIICCGGGLIYECICGRDDDDGNYW